ncbi:MAG: polysaccharide export protein [Lentisphaerae bacterium]|nr:polysaccharide export protein [Lentisphaerota bacterium]
MLSIGVLLRSTWLRLGVVCGISALVVLTSACQSPSASVPAERFDAAAGGAPLISEFFLSPSDEIAITVYQHPELSLRQKIPPSGKLFYPGLGDVPAAGRSLDQLREAIGKGLSAPRPTPIATGDELAIVVVRHPELNAQIVVPPDGEIPLPLIGNVVLTRLTPTEAGALIQKKLATYIVNPQVLVQVQKSSAPPRIDDPQVNIEVLRYGGQKLFVLGEVQRPGVFLSEGDTTVLDALSLAGGTTLDAEQKNVVLIRQKDTPGPPDMRVLDIDGVLKRGETAANVRLQRGDIVYVPRSLISNIDRFFEHLYVAIRPIVTAESGVWIGQNISAGPNRNDNNGTAATVNLGNLER